MSAPTVVPFVSDPVAAAAALTPLLRERAAEAERLATLPPDVVSAVTDAGLFRLWTPRGLGGAELPPPVMFRVIETLAAADGSAGWATMIGNSGLFLAWMDQDLAAGLLDGRPEHAMTGTFNPEGRGVPEPGGLRLSGRWVFNSGCPHARLYSTGFLAMDGPRPRMVDGRPDWRWAVYPAAVATIVPAWEGALGLRGSGSHDVVVEGVLVPEGHTVMPFYEPPVVDSALYRVPFFSLIKMMMVAVPLGIARHALDLLGELARTKVRSGPGPLAEEQDVQIRIGLAEAGLRGARAHVLDEMESLWARALAGDVPSDAERGRFTLAVNAALQASLVAVDEAFTLAGARALYADDEIQRCWRDLHATAQHRVFGRAQWQGGAKALLGLEIDRAWL
ncbi:acyl-CoA dehydrogenase family protein [Pseudonocardia xishanensis]|uniref:Acyl-CoA dehydrogenase family protein n=1 Tax=Pseudonocardia xishanensis TaxID=630995 RepID=A0ABP8RMT0_9PSEU